MGLLPKGSYLVLVVRPQIRFLEDPLLNLAVFFDLLIVLRVFVMLQLVPREQGLLIHHDLAF